MEVNRQIRPDAKRLRAMAQKALDALFETDLDHVPVERIAEILGISRASFFRYFESKDQMVLLAFLGEENDFAAALPPDAIVPDTPIWPALRAVLEPLIVASETDAPGLRRRLSLLRERPLLGAQLRRARLPQIEALASALAAQGVVPSAALTFAGVAISTLDRCILLWAGQPGSALRPLVDTAFFHLKRGY